MTNNLLERCQHFTTVPIYAPRVTLVALTLFLRKWLRDIESKVYLSQLSCHGIWVKATGIGICSSALSVELKKSIISITPATMNGVVWNVIPSGKGNTRYVMRWKIIRRLKKEEYSQKSGNKLGIQLSLNTVDLSV